MTISPMVAEWAAVYEQERGRRLDELVLRAAEYILKAGKMLTELGKKDAQEGKDPYSADAFIDLVRKAFHNIPDDTTTKEIAGLWQSDYMDGYNTEKESEESS